MYKLHTTNLLQTSLSTHFVKICGPSMTSLLVIHMFEGVFLRHFSQKDPSKGVMTPLGSFQWVFCCAIIGVRSMVLFRSFTYFSSTKASRKHACMMCHRGVFSTDAMGALAPAILKNMQLAPAIFGHFSSSTVDENCQC